MEVELFTESYAVRGTLEVSRWRLADLLNEPHRQFLLLENCYYSELSSLGEEGAGRFARYAQVNQASIAFAIPHESREMEAARQQYLAALYAEKNRLRAVVSLPSFEITGMLHLRKLFHLRQALEDLSAEFIPLTDAEAVYVPNPQVRVQAKVAIVNRPRAQIFCVGEAELEGPGSEASTVLL